MDRIAVRYDAIGEAQELMRDTGGDVLHMLRDLDVAFAPLRAHWSGEAAESFDAARDAWMRAGEGMQQNLVDMAKLLGTVDENYLNAHRANLAIWSAGGGPASGGPAGSAEISIDELRQCARSFHGLQQRLADNMSWVSRNLHGGAHGMAGGDDVLAEWRSAYDDTVTVLWAVLGDLAETLGGMAQGMTDTGNNYVEAEIASTADPGAPVPEHLPNLGVDHTRPAQHPPSATGPNGNTHPRWSSEYWPNAESASLTYAGNEWRATVGKLREISESGDRILRVLAEQNTGTVFDEIWNYWQTKSAGGGSDTILSAVATGCDTLSDSCHALSRTVRATRKSMEALTASVADPSILDYVASLLLRAPHPLAKGAGLLIEGGQYLDLITTANSIKDDYEAGRRSATDILRGNPALDALHRIRAQNITLRSERQRYDRADHGLEERIENTQHDQWASVGGPHPDPASVHITGDREQHILGGDPPPGRGGGHQAGVGKPGKTEFPPGWDRMMILNNVKDVARNPDQPPVGRKDGRWELIGVRDGVQIRVVLDPDGRVRTAFPLSGPGVDENPRKK